MKTRVLLKLITFILVAMFVTSCTTSIPKGYPFNESSSEFLYDNVVQIENRSSDELYDSIKTWIALNYNSENDVIQLDDRANHKIIVKGNFHTNLFMKDGYYRSTIVLATKENKYRYIITVSSYYSVGSGEMSFNSSSMGFKGMIFGDVDSKVSATIKSLNDFVARKNAEFNDW